MINKTAYGYEIHCDWCSNSVEYDGHDFQTATQFIKSDGWMPVRDNGNGWLNKCPDCERKPAK